MPDYAQMRRLGQGNFGEVWPVFDGALGVERAVKYVARFNIHNPTEFYGEPRNSGDTRLNREVNKRY